MSRTWRADSRRKADRLYTAAAELGRAIARTHDIGDKADLERRRRQLCNEARSLEIRATYGPRP